MIGTGTMKDTDPACGMSLDPEEAATRGLLAAFPPLAQERAGEALERTSREARFVHACDKLQLGVRLLGYLRAGQRGLGHFRDGLAELSIPEFEPCETLRRELLAAIDAIGAEA